jgi:hypothetical protein
VDIGGALGAVPATLFLVGGGLLPGFLCRLTGGAAVVLALAGLRLLVDFFFA